MKGESVVLDVVQPRETSGNASALLDVVRGMLADLGRTDPDSLRIDLDSTLDRDLGLDSLARVELLTRIERKFDVLLPHTVLQSADTCRALLAAMQVATSVHRAAPPVVARARFEAPQGTVGEALVPPRTTPTLIDMLAWHVEHHGQRVAMTLCDEPPGQPVAYEQLWREAHTVAGGLQQAGLQAGDTVALMLPTSADYFFGFFGVLLAGGIPVPIYPPTRFAQIEEHIRRHARILENASAATLIAVPEVRAAARLLRLHAPSLRRIATVSELRSIQANPTPVGVNADSIAFLQYTSGSTGQPKGVVLTHANLLANLRALGAALKIDRDDIFVSWLPLYHDMGLIGAGLGTLYFGVPLVLMSPLAFLAQPARWLWTIARHGGTLTAAPNFAYELCLKRIADEELTGLDLGSLRMAANGAEAAMPGTIVRFQERFASYGLRPTAMTPVYGLAESSVGLTFPPLNRGPLIDCIDRDALMRSGLAKPVSPDAANPLRFVSCGAPLADHQIRIVDDAGRELHERAEGRLEFKGPSATRGYYRNPQATERLMHDEWLDTGDRAYLAAGELYVTGRVKDIVIRAGRHIYPEELELAVGELDGVRKGCVAVFGSVDAASGTERLVVMAETYAQDAAQLARLRERITERVVTVLGEPPDDVVLAPPHTVLKTSSGKLRRAASRELYESGRHAARSQAVWRQIVRLIASSARPYWLRTGRRIAETFYVAYFYASFVLLGLPTWLIAILLPRPNWAWKVSRAAARLFIRLARISFVVRGADRVPPGAAVVVANHASYLDGLYIMAALTKPCSFVAKRELLNNFATRWYLRRIGAEFVERFATLASVADAERLTAGARAGRSLVVFPEGTFTRAPGLMPFHLGAFTVAATAGLPVVPIAIRGARSVLCDDQWWPRRGPIVIEIGNAIPAPVGVDAFAAAVRLRDAARAHIIAGCGEPDLERREGFASASTRRTE